VDNIFYKPMHPYTLGLMDSITRLDEEKREKLKPITGSPPSLIDLPEGCAFKKRCEFGSDACARSYPPLREIEKGHFVACCRVEDILKNRIGK
jgi:oligopeptide/dipeptide ABC transporter ATP-binding protein